MNNSIRIEENKYLILPKLKRVKLKYHREIPKNYRIKSVTFTNSNGNYYVSVLTEFEKEIQKLSERGYKCECCGIEIDRNYNTALNIKNIGKEMMEY